MGNLVHLLISQYIQIISFNICCNIRALRREPTFFSGVWYNATEVVLRALFPPEMDSEVSIWVQAVYLGHDPRAHTSRGIENWDNWRKSIKAFIIKQVNTLDYWVQSCCEVLGASKQFALQWCKGTGVLSSVMDIQLLSIIHWRLFPQDRVSAHHIHVGRTSCFLKSK